MIQQCRPLSAISPGWPTGTEKTGIRAALVRQGQNRLYLVNKVYLTFVFALRARFSLSGVADMADMADMADSNSKGQP